VLTPPTIRRIGFLTAVPREKGTIVMKTTGKVTAVPREKGTIVMKTTGKEMVDTVASFERPVVM
jgi:hypothetical protein